LLQEAVACLVGGMTCLGSVPRQTMASFEVVIVDDGSDEAVRLENRNDAAIRILHLPRNRGTPAALNAGIAAACGEYVYILAADDLLEPWSLERMLDAAVPGRVVYGDVRVVRDGARQELWKLSEYDCRLVWERNPMPGGGVLYERRCWQDAGGYDERFCFGREDWAFNVRCMLAGWYGQHIGGESGYLYRRDGQNRSVILAGTRPAVAPPGAFDTWQGFYGWQIRTYYPKAEEVAMGGCCGGRRAAQPRQQPVPMSPKSAQALPDKAGYEVVEYIGPSVGVQTFTVGATAYRFGRLRQRGYVLKEHVAALLSMRRGGQLLFRVYRQPPATAPTPPPQDTTVHTDDAVVATPPTDPSTLTAADIRALQLDAETARWMLEAERAGRNRATVVTYLMRLVDG
jgi:hypothetical protein